jgi:N,N'-diacetylchitobiose phosphorylase
MNDGGHSDRKRERDGSSHPVHLLSNGRYSVLVSPAGGSYSAFEGLALTRWAPDPTRQADGFFLYVRDLESGRSWSAGYQPLPAGHESYRSSFPGDRVEIARRSHGIGTVTTIGVATDADIEVRRFRLTNHGDSLRTLQVTTYAELALNTPAADAGHPAFSKLFVQTGYRARDRALIAWRRLRSPDDSPLWLAHRLLLDTDGEAPPAPDYETDRARFIGRGRSVSDPRALDAGERLSGSVGNVLDPIFSLRRVVELPPGASVDVFAWLAASHSERGMGELISRFATVDAARRALEETRPPPCAAERSLGLPSTWAGALDLLASGSSPAEPAPPPSPNRSTDRRHGGAARPEWADEPLQLFNGIGGFSGDGTEYVIRLEPDPASGALRLPPQPWINVVAGEEVGFLISERGAGYTWSVNSRENRLTPWSNDPVSDPHGEALYLRDEEDGAFWSPTPGPAPGAGTYEVRHGFGYSRFRHGSRELDLEVLEYVPRQDPVKIVRVRITNPGERRRRLSLFSYAQLVLGGLPAETRLQVDTEHDERIGAVLARNPRRGVFSDRVAFAATVAPPGIQASFTTSRTSFLGPLGSMDAPAALVSGEPLDGVAGRGLDPCAAFRLTLEVGPGETVECAFLLGETGAEHELPRLLARYRAPGALQVAFDEVRNQWRELLSRVRVETPSPAIDLMVNGWLAYQNLACRMWGRSAFYQSGGAFGFRDQLQDSSALLYLDPELTRRQILLHAAHQFVEGDVMHWWHPPSSAGIRTRFSDDLLWLPYITAFYLRSTGDPTLLGEEVRFLTAPPLADGDDELFLTPEDSGERGTVYEHCCRAIDRSLTRGAHGLPLMGVGDWNDGMNRVGREGRGESVWLGFFLHDILEAFIPICEASADHGRVSRYRAYQRDLGVALEDAGWDGGWYRRAYYDNGTPLGSAESDECRIDTLAQAWAVISRVAPAERAEQALDAMEEYLVSEPDGLVRLLAPAFDRTVHDPGYIKGYLPGVRENGGQYTHAALWAIRALAEVGRDHRAARLLEMLSPISHTATPEGVAIYQVEPYVIAADVYGVEPHVGRGGWSWYTGSAGWMFRVALESVLGLQLRDGRSMALRPCIPDVWAGYRICYRLPDGATTYEIELRRSATPQASTRASLDREELAVEDGAVIVPLATDGRVHHVRVELGHDVGPRYRSSTAPAATSS